MNLNSDNVLGCAPEMLAAIAAVNEGAAVAYGGDAVTQRLRDVLAQFFDTPVDVFPVVSGTAANALALSASVPPWGATWCHEFAHAHCHEMGATEFYGGGAKMVPISGPNGKLVPSDTDHAIGEADSMMAQPACLSITQCTEAGTVYTLDEIRAFGAIARRRGLVLHMDGARFANGAAALGCSPADMTWRAGVDILSFGATKNGAMAAEAIVVFRHDLSATLEARRTRGGHVLSKARFVSAQIEAMYGTDLWLRNARHANDAAAYLWSRLEGLPGVQLARPVETNHVFLHLPAGVADAVRAAGHVFEDWAKFGRDVVRLVTGFNTRREDLDAFVSDFARACGGVRT